MTFPSNPSNNDTYNSYGRTFIFNSSSNAWRNFKSGDFVEASAAAINQANTLSNIHIGSFADVNTANLTNNDVLVFNTSQGAFINQTNVSLNTGTFTNGIFTNCTITNLSFPKLTETVNVVGSAPTSTTNYDLLTAAIHYYTVNMTTNITLNIRGNSSSTLNSILPTGQSITCSLLVKNGSAQYYPNVIQIDGTTVTVKWQTSAPTNGNSNKTDLYSFSIIKTADATFTVLGSQADFS